MPALLLGVLVFCVEKKRKTGGALRPTKTEKTAHNAPPPPSKSPPTTTRSKVQTGRYMHFTIKSGERVGLVGKPS